MLQLTLLPSFVTNNVNTYFEGVCVGGGGECGGGEALSINLLKAIPILFTCEEACADDQFDDESVLVGFLQTDVDTVEY